MTPFEESDLPPDEHHFVAKLREQYAPQPRTAAQRAGFTDAIAHRVRRRHLPIWQPMAAAACAAVFALWLVYSGRFSPNGGPQLAPAEPGEAILALALENDDVARADDILPTDYATLADVFDL